jgi:hypothetical protein
LVLAELLRDANVLVDPGVLRRPAVQQRDGSVNGDDEAEKVRAEQPGSRLGTAQLRQQAGQQQGQAYKQPGVGVRKQPVGPDRLALGLAYPEGPDADPGEQKPRKP